MAVHKKVPFERNAVRHGILLCDDPHQQGPSALVAAYNILAIRHSSVYGKEGPIEQDTIKDVIRGTLQIAHQQLGRFVSRSAKRQASKTIDALPARTTDVTPLPGGASSFGANDLCVLLSHLGIDLMHGWVVDPESSVYESVKDLSPAKLAQHCASLQGLEEKKDELALVQGLLNDSARQLTAYGFASLLGKVDEGDFAVVFCHSRFNVVHKHDGELFILETDAEVRSRFPQVVWRLVDEGVEEDCIYLNGQFIPVKGQPNIAKAREWFQEKLRDKKISTETAIGTTSSSTVERPTRDHESDDEISGNGELKPQTKGQRRKCRDRRKR